VYPAEWTKEEESFDRGMEDFRFLRNKAEAGWIQLIPVVESINERGYTLNRKGVRVSKSSVQPE
jgi:sulfatase maturation enzyme AslB (radical SAM superfamily)